MNIEKEIKRVKAKIADREIDINLSLEGATPEDRLEHLKSRLRHLDLVYSELIAKGY